MKQERAELGKHFDLLRSDLSKAGTEAIISALDGSPALEFLAREPIKEIEFSRSATRAGGVYTRQDRLIQVNTIRRWGQNYGEAFAPGLSSSLSKATGDKTESMRRSLVHEVAHHIEEIGGEAVAKIGREAYANVASKPITRYAAISWPEYFAESWSAFHALPESLQSFDTVGYEMIEDIISVLREQANEQP